MAYSAKANVEQLYGPDNVASWADLDNDEDVDKIAARIAAAILYADAEIDDILRGGPYALPLANSESTTPTSVVGLSATLAGVWLYERRGVEDFDEESGRPYHRLAWAKKDAYDKLKEILSNKRKIDAVRQTVGLPAVIEDDDLEVTDYS